MGDLGNQDISEYIGLSVDRLEEIYRELNLFINPAEVADRMNLVGQLIVYSRENPSVNLTPEFLATSVSRNPPPVYGDINSLRITYQRLRDQLQPPRGGRKYRSVSRKSRKSTRRRRR